MFFFYHSFHTEFTEIKSTEYYYFIKKGVFGNGNLGVNFFFVLSGFLITYLLIREKNQKGKINIPFFWIRRILRIWPLYFISVIFGFYIFPILKAYFGQTPNETANIYYYLSFLSNFDMIKKGLPDASTLGVLWSVAIEEQFYLIWPLLLFLFPVKKYWIVFLSIISASIAFRTINLTNPNQGMLFENHTLSCIGDMAMGAMGAWLITNTNFLLEKIKNLKKIEILLIYLSFFAIFFFRRNLFYWNSFTLVIERLIISTVILLIILEQNYAKNSFFKMSKFKKASYLGTISYGLYTLHFIGILIAINITRILEINHSFWQIFFLETALALAFTIIISYVSYNFYEKPFLKFKDKFSFIRKH